MLTFGCSNQARSTWLNFASPSRDAGESRRAFSPDILDQTTVLQRYMSEKKYSNFDTLRNSTTLKPSKDIARNMKQ